MSIRIYLVLLAILLIIIFVFSVIVYRNLNGMQTDCNNLVKSAHNSEACDLTPFIKNKNHALGSAVISALCFVIVIWCFFRFK